ncbi:hypothetical protein ACJMK2_019911, partial [Sinanodonta woodiana]
MSGKNGSGQHQTAAETSGCNKRISKSVLGKQTSVDRVLPEGTIKRKLGEETYQYWSDEQIPVYDCMDRLAGYSIVGLVDFDEFIFPLKDKDFKQFVNRIRTRYPDAGFFIFLVDVFVTDWGKTNERENLTIAQFRNRTTTMSDRIKNFVIPERIQTGSVSTHNAEPKYGYK